VRRGAEAVIPSRWNLFGKTGEFREIATQYNRTGESFAA